MKYISSEERLALKKGRREAKREGLLGAIEMGLSIKFGDNGLRFLPMIRSFEDISRLESLKELIKATDNLSEIESLVA